MALEEKGRTNGAGCGILYQEAKHSVTEEGSSAARYCLSGQYQRLYRLQLFLDIPVINPIVNADKARCIMFDLLDVLIEPE